MTTVASIGPSQIVDNPVIKNPITPWLSTGCGLLAQLLWIPNAPVPDTLNTLGLEATNCFESIFSACPQWVLPPTTTTNFKN